jgi:hypothetical protein
MDRLFDHYLGRKPAAAEEGESAAGGTGERKRGSVTGLARWKKAENVVKSYVGNLLHLLRNLVEPRMTAFVLHHLLRLIPYLAPFPRIARLFLKHLIHLWTSAEEAVRLLAFLNIREMVHGSRCAVLVSVASSRLATAFLFPLTPRAGPQHTVPVHRTLP